MSNAPYTPPNLPTYPNNPTKVQVIREDAFSKPGTMSKGTATAKGKGWKPAKGGAFRSTAEKAKGRPRKNPRDPRYREFY